MRPPNVNLCKKSEYVYKERWERWNGTSGLKNSMVIIILYCNVGIYFWISTGFCNTPIKDYSLLKKKKSK